MTPDQQVKTIMEIFTNLTHENQVELFNEIKSQLLNHRKAMHEAQAKHLEESKINM